MSIREEIGDACRRLGLSTEQFAEVEDRQARELTAVFLSRFTGGEDVRWWWERFAPPVASLRCADQRAFTRISALVPDADEKVWFVAEENELPYYPVYETTPALAQQVIGECYGFEYYLIAKDLSWLLCENHHDRFIAVGAMHDRLIGWNDDAFRTEADGQGGRE
jgi:hypothetical protein